MSGSADGFRGRLSAVVLLAAAVAATPAAAQVISEFSVPSSGQPLHIAPGPGGMWFTETGSRIGRITTDGRVSEFAISRPAWRIVAGPDGNLWFTSDGFVSRMTPGGVVTDFPVSGNAWGITVGPDRDIWFTELQQDGSTPDNVLWGILGRATLDGQITETLIEPWSEDITSGPGGDFWVPDWTEIGNDAIVRVTPSGTQTRFVLPGGLHGPGDVGPSAVTIGSDGNVWFVLTRTKQVGRITPAGAIRVFDAPGERGIAAGPDGNIWITESSANKVGRLTTAGELVEFDVPSARGLPWGIAAGTEGNIWFTEAGAARIGKITFQPDRSHPRPPDRRPQSPRGPGAPR